MASEQGRNGKRSEPEVKAVFKVRTQSKRQAHETLKKLGVPREPRRDTRSRWPHTGGILN